MLGNAFIDFKYDGKAAFVPMAFYHGLIDDELHDFMKHKCDFSYNYIRGNKSIGRFCENEKIELFDYYVGFANPYDVFGKCYKNHIKPQPTVYNSHSHLQEAADGSN